VQLALFVINSFFVGCLQMIVRLSLDFIFLLNQIIFAILAVSIEVKISTYYFRAATTPFLSSFSPSLLSNSNEASLVL